ncbi:sulfotransferase family protein [Nocardioides sp.]|uniref:sulfotransferase family protein n=1 Tax=Nocardioides sp. TaxID=35761 RepID=UPI002736A160|nr:sulfotransferase [Nocardioides sp.]MDP3894821.1 sulfotransferase [Nocardioides sp.]
MADRSLVMVIGPGRSGTSTMAGALASSGYHVPNAIKPNDRNPRGFFEPRWVVNFHRRLLRETGVGTLDSDPHALPIVERRISRPDVHAELREWLSEQFGKRDRLVIKDPRMVWFRDLWVSVASELGADPRFVIMLRHPSEVSASRSTYYQARDVGAVAGWINVALTSEHLTAASPRSLVPYGDLLTDWRGQFSRIQQQLDIPLDPGPEVHPHPVDDFIDPTLRRMSTGWETVAVPRHLSDLADRVYDVLHEIAVDGDSPERADLVEQLRQEYSDTFEAAKVLVRRDRKRAEDRIRRRTRNRVRKQMARRQQARQAPTGLLPRSRDLARRLRNRAKGRR